MDKILILGGTSTTHEIVKNLNSDFIISVATQYGYDTFGKIYGDKVVLQRFDEQSLIDFIKKNGIIEIIDTTHPFAKEISLTAKKVSDKISILYTNKIRNTDSEIDYENAYIFNTYDEIIEFLTEKKYKTILFTIGANNIHRFKNFSSNSYARVLPFEKSIKACIDTGFKYERIIGMQGPFSEKFNIALIEEFKIDCMVTKNSGKGSGFYEKLKACRNKNIDFIIKSL